MRLRVGDITILKIHLSCIGRKDNFYFMKKSLVMDETVYRILLLCFID